MRSPLTRLAWLLVTFVGAGGCLAAPALADTGTTVPSTATYTAIPGSVPTNPSAATGQYSSPSMSVEVTLAPSNQSKLQSMLQAVNTPSSSSYQQWLAPGQFDTDFAPSSSEATAVKQYLVASGLTITPAASPFLIAATGSSAQVSAAFKTTLDNYTGNHGVSYFSNATAVQVPSTIAGEVTGVIGLTNTLREHSDIQRTPSAATSAASTHASCETAYPTVAELFATYPNDVGFPYGYGAGPGCSGLTPAQDNSIYDAPKVGPTGKGSGENIAVFELSAYQKSDITHWAHQFYGSSYTPPLVNKDVDGTPNKPQCPTGDTCPPQYNGFSGDIEVDADIEMQLAIAPDASQLTVYQAPNDYTGQTELDLYTRVAKNDTADVLSSSWGDCENDVTAAYAQAENTVFEQMALQGQSVFGSSGDTGAFGCIRSDGTTISNVNDPSSQPWVTSVGGTSLEGFNPGDETAPSYPNYTETVWNVGNLCNTTSDEGGLSGYSWCAETGAGGGGISQFWGRPYYQSGPGVDNTYTEDGNGTTQCSLASNGTPCREVPDISMNADEFTPYAEYCTGTAAQAYSDCATFSGAQNVPGWFGIGGTSLSSPFMSAIIADRDSYQGHRQGNANPMLYQLFDQSASTDFHDITASGQNTTNDGLYPATTGYDLATGIGSAMMAPIITGQG